MSSIAELVGIAFAAQHNVDLTKMCESFDLDMANQLVEDNLKVPSYLVPNEPVFNDEGTGLISNGKRFIISPESSGIEEPILVVCGRLYKGGIKNTFTATKKVAVKGEDGKPVLVDDGNGNMVTKMTTQTVTYNRLEQVKVPMDLNGLKKSPNEAVHNVMNSLDTEQISKDKGQRYISLLGAWADDRSTGEEVEVI